MADCTAPILKPPTDCEKHLERLFTAYAAGDLLALFQAFYFARERQLPLPNWVAEPLEDTVLGALTSRRGRPGRGNSSFGDLRKAYIRTIRASAYHYVRAWQRDPHLYSDLPNRTLDDWYAGYSTWSSNRGYSDAARLAATGLRGTEFQANASTVRKAANRFPTPVRWGRALVEKRFQLRGPKGVFGSSHLRQSDDVKVLLSNRKPKLAD